MDRIPMTIPASARSPGADSPGVRFSAQVEERKAIDEQSAVRNPAMSPATSI